MTDLAIDVPKPGEPLKEMIDPANRAALDEEVKARHELVRAKLSKRELRRLKKRYAHLHAKLNRARYNHLVSQRAELHQTFVMVRAAYRQKPTNGLKKRGQRLAAAGRDLNAKIKALAPLASEFADVAARLRAHERVIELERQEAQDREAFYREADTWEGQIQAVFRQTPRLHHIVRADGKEYMRIPEIQRIICKPDKMYFQIRTVRQGLIDRWTQTWHSALPYGVDVKNLTCDETLQNLAAACGRIVTVERSKKSQNLFYVVHRLDSADGIPNTIHYHQVVDYYPRERHERTPWAAGVGEDRKVQWFDFEEYPHILIAGASGGGKSNLINQLLATLITMNSPEEVRLVLVDNKGGVELTHFSGIPHELVPMIKNTDDVLPALQRMRAVMESRFAAFLAVSARNLSSYNARVKQRLPRIILVVDEMATLLGLGDLTAKIHQELRVLSSQGRAVGIHLVVSTQHPSVDVLPGWIKTNMTLRVASKMPNHTASQIIVDSVTAAILPDIPGRMVFRRGGFELLLQTPLIEDDGIARAVKLSREYPTPEKEEGETESDVVIVPVPKFGRDDLIKTALEHFDGKLSPTRIAQFVGDDLITNHECRKLVHRVVDEITAAGGVVTINGITYKLGKDRKTHVLSPIGQPLATVDESGTVSDSATTATIAAIASVSLEAI